jgi:CO/xanthine dehydrogenase Mo-binding subunit
VVDAGAYAIYGAIVPMLTSTHILGVYKLPNFECGMRVAYSHRVPLGAVRGAGRPQGTYVMDRVVDLAARELKLDPVEIRFKNFVQPHEMPYSTGFPLPGGKTVTFDSGDYPGCLRLAMEKAKYPELRAQQAAARARGRHLGVGIACYIEATTIGPYEGATVRIDSLGKVLVMTGSGPQGQGHETTMAQVCAAELGVPMEDVGFVAADTDAFPVGTGTFASRVATMTSNAVIVAARKVRDKALTIAAAMLEASQDDLVMESGKLFVRGAPGRSLTLAEIAQAAHGRPGATLPGGVTPGLEATDYFVPTGTIWSNGANIAVVEVDPETGGVKVLRYVVAHDCGKVINPMLVDGQIHGGVVHGISNALFEDLPYNEAGQPLYGSFMDYLLPTAAEIPLLELTHMETPSPLNPAGIKGAGESGTIPAHQAITAAVEDALAPFGVRVREFPLNPARIRRMIEETTG